MHSSLPTASHLPVAKAPFLWTAGLFCALAIFIARMAIGSLGASDVLGIVACAAAATAFATIPFSVDFARRLHPAQKHAALTASSSPTVEAMSTQIAAAIDARLAAALPEWTEQLASALAASDQKHREAVLRTLAGTPPRPVDADLVTAPLGKARLGRGLEGLIRGATPTAVAPVE